MLVTGTLPPCSVGNGRIIKLDDRLAKLLGKTNGFEIPIINVQTHLRDHYVKVTPPAASE